MSLDYQEFSFLFDRMDVPESYKIECFSLIVKIAQHFVDLELEENALQVCEALAGEEFAADDADQIEFDQSLGSTFQCAFREAASKKE